MKLRKVTMPRDSLTLRRALGMDWDMVAAEVESGHAECIEIDGYGHVITRLEQHTLTDLKTLVIVGAGTYAPQKIAGPVVVPVLIDLAAANGADFMRVHSRRPGMARYLEQHGFKFKGAEYGRQIKQ